MDLNYLFLRQQVERTLSERAATNAAKAAHEGMARKYELEIERETGGRIMFPGHPQEELIAPPSPSASS